MIAPCATTPNRSWDMPIPMADQLDVYARTESSDDWSLALNAVPASMSEELSRAASLRQDPNQDLNITHLARVPYDRARRGLGDNAAPRENETTIETGNRVRRIRDGAEFLVKGIRHHARPGHRYAVLLLTRAGDAVG